MNDANLTALERLIETTQALAIERDHRTIAAALGDAAKLCGSARAVQSATSLQLQAALAELRANRAERAIEYIERAVDIQKRWAACA